MSQQQQQENQQQQETIPPIIEPSKRHSEHFDNNNNNDDDIDIDINADNNAPLPKISRSKAPSTQSLTNAREIAELQEQINRLGQHLADLNFKAIDKFQATPEIVLLNNAKKLCEESNELQKEENH